MYEDVQNELILSAPIKKYIPESSSVQIITQPEKCASMLSLCEYPIQGAKSVKNHARML